MSKAKGIVGLDCEASAVEGIRLLLNTRLEEMSELKAGALDWSDIEGVHDMRVASRRLRSALRDFKPYLKRRKHLRAVDAIKRIADSLGTVRDRDVAIAALEKLLANAPPDVAVGIELFAAERRARREDDRRFLVEAVADDQLVRLRAEFCAALEGTIAIPLDRKSRVAVDHIEVSFRAAGQVIIKARMNELQGFCKSLYHPLKTKQLHRMRIAAKRLRYAIELFSQCWKTQLDSFAKEVAKLQTSLGELHDCDVWIAEFGRLLAIQNGINSPPGLIDTDAKGESRRHAYVWLLSHFTRRRTNHYRDALVRWHEWETTGFLARLEACMHSLPANREPSHAVLSIVNAGR